MEAEITLIGSEQSWYWQQKKHMLNEADSLAWYREMGLTTNMWLQKE